MILLSPSSVEASLIWSEHTRPVDATLVRGRAEAAIYQGSLPPEGSLLKRQGFDVLVLAAEEYQPESHRFPGVEVIHAPLFDEHEQGAFDVLSARRTALLVTNRYRDGKKILVTCHEGRNRSGWIVGLALTMLGMSGRNAVDRIRRRRANALTNRTFVADIVSGK